MRGKFTTKTIIIAIIALLVLVAAVTGTVVFLKDSGEAAAAQEQELLNAMQNEESQEKSDDTTKEGENLPELGDEEERTNQSNTGNANITNNTNNDRIDNSDTLAEQPAPSTVERERVISETTTLGWNNIGLNSSVGASKLLINYSNLEYKVEYYFDGILEEGSLVVVGGNSKGKIIDTYENKVKVGYKLDKVENLPLTISENEEENVIKVSYIKDEEQVKDISYTVKYFIEDKEQESDRKVIKETVWVNAKETMTFDKSLLNKEYTGYKKVGTKPEIVGETVNNGDVIEVYYEKDEEQVKDISYTVKYFIENKEQELDRKVITETVWVKAKETMTFDKSLLNKEYTGYKKVGTKPETVGTTVNNGDVIEVYYEKASFRYTIYYYKDSIAGENLLGRISDSAEYGTRITADTTKYLPITGYMFKGTAPSMIIGENAAENILNVFYTKVTNLSYTIKYLEKGTNKELKTETISNQEYNKVIKISDLEIPSKITSGGKEYKYSNEYKTAQEPPITGQIIIGADLSKNVITLYYERPDIKAEKTSTVETNSAIPGKAYAGDEITYRIKVWNVGSGSKQVKIEDTNPTGTTLKANSASVTSGEVKESNGKVTWIVKVPANTTKANAKELTFKVIINDNTSGVIKNTAKIDGKTGPNDGDGIEVIKPANITVSKTSSNTSGEVKYGDFITYTLTARNDGDEGGNVVIKDADLQALIDSKKVKLTNSTIKTSDLANGISIYVPANDTKEITYTVQVIANVTIDIKNRVEVIKGGKVDDEHKEVEVDTVKYVTVNKLRKIATNKNIIIAIDKSASMIGGDYNKAKKAVQNIIEVIYPNDTEFTNNLINTKIIAYAGIKYGNIHSCSTIGSASNYSNAESLKKKVGNSLASGEWTNLKNTLEYIAGEVDTSVAKENNIVIFVGDGGTGITQGINWKDCVNASNSLKAISTVFTIDVGNSEAMKNMASSTTTYCNVNGYDTSALTAALKKIITTITVDKENSINKTDAEGKILLEGIKVDSAHPVTINLTEYHSMPKTIVKIDEKYYLDLTQFEAGETVSITYYRK